MFVKTKKSIRIYDPESQGEEFIDSLLEWTLGPNDARVSISRPDGPTYESCQSNLWECLLEIRGACEPLGVRICINGCRSDCYPSGMGIQMGGGRQVIIRTMGEQVTDLAAVVETFAPAELSQVGTVNEQEAYYRAWLSSLPQ